MFKRFFDALNSLVANVETLAASFAEANDNLRDRLGLGQREDVPALPGPESAKNNGRRIKTNA